MKFASNRAPTDTHFCDSLNLLIRYLSLSFPNFKKVEITFGRQCRVIYTLFDAAIRCFTVEIREQTRIIILAPLLLAFFIFSMGAHGDRTTKSPNLHRSKLPSYLKSFENKRFESRKFSKRFKIKGWRIGEDLYVGGVKAAGDYGPGIVLDKGRYTWGFNHQGMEFQLRF